MTQDVSQDLYTVNNDMTVPYFTNRLKTFLVPDLGQSYRNNVVKQYVDFVNNNFWKKFWREIPVINWFVRGFGEVNDSLHDNDWSTISYQF